MGASGDATYVGKKAMLAGIAMPRDRHKVVPPCNTHWAGGNQSD